MAGLPEVRLEQAVASTNDVAIEEAREGAVHGWAVCAERQTAGRGRRGHTWESPAGSLYLSVVLRPAVGMQSFVALPAVCAMGVMDALGELGLSGKVGIKWPNDIVAGAPAFDHKLAGILVEARSSAEGPFAVAGIGLNVQPVEVADADCVGGEAVGPRPLAPVSLAELLEGVCGTAAADAGAALEPADGGGGVLVPEPAELAVRLRDAVVARVDAWVAAAAVSQPAAGPLMPILSEYFDMVPMLGHQVAALSPTGHVMATGAFAGLDGWGRAVIMTAAGEESFPAEAVSLRAL